jgi:hypothetical protein
MFKLDGNCEISTRNNRYALYCDATPESLIPHLLSGASHNSFLGNNYRTASVLPETNMVETIASKNTKWEPLEMVFPSRCDKQLMKPSAFVNGTVRSESRVQKRSQRVQKEVQENTGSA